MLCGALTRLLISFSLCHTLSHMLYFNLHRALYHLVPHPPCYPRVPFSQLPCLSAHVLFCMPPVRLTVFCLTFAMSSVHTHVLDSAPAVFCPLPPIPMLHSPCLALHTIVLWACSPSSILRILQSVLYFIVHNSLFCQVPPILHSPPCSRFQCFPHLYSPPSTLHSPRSPLHSVDLHCPLSLLAHSADCALYTSCPIHPVLSRLLQCLILCSVPILLCTVSLQTSCSMNHGLTASFSLCRLLPHSACIPALCPLYLRLHLLFSRSFSIPLTVLIFSVALFHVL